MICQQCHKKVETPLELYDGGWACPHCKHGLMSAFSDFSVTRENEELFTLSERSYYRWLTNARRGQEGRAWLDKAVELCRESARLGNPLAVTRLGYYYDKDYVEENRSEAVRCRIAYAYYSAVCFSDAELKVQEGVLGRYEWKQIRVRAAEMMLNMLAFAPEELTALDKFNFAYNRSRVRAKLGIDTAAERVEPMRVGRDRQTFETLYSCFAKQRAPLFGIFRLSGEELKRLFGMSVGNRFDACRMAERGLYLGIIACGRGGGVAEDGGTFTALRNRARIGQVLVETEDGASLCLYFFNESGGHRFFGRYGLGAIRKALEANRFALVKRLIDDGGRMDYTFLDDDVYLYKTTARGGADAVKKLINAVCEGENG